MFSIVTGGAGFIGSHLVDALVARGDDVCVIDSLAAGSTHYLEEHIASGTVQFQKADLLHDNWQTRCEGADRIFHLAADPDVRGSAAHPLSVYENNVTATVSLLEAMREHQVPEIVFTSTSTVYGEASVIPTPEDYSPMEPISVYGASKLASEAMIASYCHTYGMKGSVFRFANIIGARSNHGVLFDFIRKLRQDPQKLEILGDGKQTKSYLSVQACVDGMMYASERGPDLYNVYNIGSDDWIDVISIADIVVWEMGLSDVAYRFSGGDRGWVGDVPKMLLSIEKIKNLGWQPGIGSQESVREAVLAGLAEI
ncbi:MAG: NAD-dependent epimerase/dehydratase family protein [Methanocalculus sp. MSAO_Arc1]|uniref:NAD-dependent epimerase/dehydratase family protein n=1 Tax=Methanocalculus TaxID=71151 RepID=UPI000FF3C1E0|nr:MULTISPECIES: NAD-dependent epimerase/dehydratase family protein [unclassified Methanocalculus]MCP1663096.1 UDP-glucose 4-epimerase [Methanocalculus sp. AMF5]RQD81766.1 MAG: NAD-dependent epimerase/dehydratase family protein [Methanocalculus sp. MSAO_Arc1]